MLKITPVIGLSAGAIIALILAILIVLTVLGYVGYLLLQKRKTEEKQIEEEKVITKEEKLEEKKEKPVIIKEEKPKEKEPPVKEDKEAEPVVEKVAVKEEKKVEPVIEKVVAVEAKPKKEMLNYSFQSRLHLSDKETSNRYNDLKNHLLKYEGVTNNISWKQETFVVKGKMVAKLRLQGKSLRVYLGLDPNDYVDTKYNLSDESKSKTHETTPALLVVKGPRLLQYALELVDDYMNQNEIIINEDYEIQDYKEKPLTQEKLIEMGLIKTQKSVF